MTKRILNLDLVLGAIIALVFIAFSHMRFFLFEAIERYVYDVEMRFAQKKEHKVPEVVLINIDDKSLASLGSWPWPRSLIAQMVDILRESKARLIGIYIPFVEKETNPGLTALELFYEKFNAYPFGERDSTLTTWMLENLKQMEVNLNNDKRLVESVQQSGNVVLPAVVQFESSHNEAEREENILLSKNFIKPLRVSASLRKKLSINNVLLPFPELAQSVLGLGHNMLTLGDRMAGQSHPMFLSYEGSPLPSFPLRLAMGYFNLQPTQVFVENNYIRLGGYRVPIINGELLIKFENGQGAFPQYSFVDILQAKPVPPMLKGKVVLIGFNSRESTRVNTPVLPTMAEGEFIANILDNIINKTFITRPPFMFHIEVLTMFLLSVIVSYIFPRMGQISRLGSAIGLIVLTLLSGMFLFFELGVWLKTTYTANCILTLYLTVSLKQLFASKRTIRDSIEMNRLLGLGFQSQGLLDLAFDKFRRLPVDNETKDLIYGLGLDYERNRMINKALTTYEYIEKWGRYRDLAKRIPKLRASDNASTIGGYGDRRDGSIFSDSSAESRSRVGRYNIIEELGKGTMGQVYKALDPKINRLLAIKTIRFSDEFEEDVIQDIKKRFFREAEIAGQLSFPSIVTIYDVGEDRDLTYMAMEFLEGMNLENFITKENLLPFRKILEVIADVAEALDFAHKADVIHRDIKPANIMLLKSGGVKVTDFGIAKAISSSRTKTGVILGTPNYMSPEQIMGQKIDLRSDLFSLGVLFFQLLTGELPFQGENLSSLLFQITQVKHPSVRRYNPQIPKVCDQILDKTLAKDPKERLRSAGEMARVIRLLAAKIDELRKKRALKEQPIP